MRRAAMIEGAHQMPVRDVDIARGNMHLLVSAGDDCRLRVWDLRRAPAGGCSWVAHHVAVKADVLYVHMASRFEGFCYTWLHCAL